MTDTRSTGQEIQTEVLGAVRKSEEMLADAMKLWADTVQSPKPEEFVAGAYDFAEQMLISQRKLAESWLEATRSQRKFTESWLEATKPLLGAVNGTAATKGATR